MSVFLVYLLMIVTKQGGDWLKEEKRPVIIDRSREMNIQEAKKEICNTLRAYLAKDEDGYYIYPLVRQRPILMIGPPGIGKTAIMEQAAADSISNCNS